MTKATKATSKVTEVGKHEMMWVVEHRLQDLRKFVDVCLAEQGMNHTRAASRAKVSKSHWSNVVNGDRITDTELKVIARGLKMSAKKLLSKLDIGPSE